MSKRAEWERIIKEQRGSGQSVSKYCGERGISDKSFGYWLRRLGEESAGVRVVGGTRFATVGTAAATIEFASPSGIRACVPVGTSLKDLRLVVEALCAQHS